MTTLYKTLIIPVLCRMLASVSIELRVTGGQERTPESHSKTANKKRTTEFHSTTLLFGLIVITSNLTSDPTSDPNSDPTSVHTSDSTSNPTPNPISNLTFDETSSG